MISLPRDFALSVDLYELTMVDAYLREGLTEPSVFSLFARRLPQGRAFLVACGLDDAIDALENLSFSAESISYLASLCLFSDSLLDWLRAFRFQGDVFAIPEGTCVFPNEPVLEVVASLPQAQLVETLVMNQLCFGFFSSPSATENAISLHGASLVSISRVTSSRPCSSPIGMV